MKKIICSLCLVFISCGHYTYVGRSAHSNFLFTAKGTFYGPKEWFMALLADEKKEVIPFALSDDLLFNRESELGTPRIVVLYAMHHKSRYWLKVAAFREETFRVLETVTRIGDRVSLVIRGKPPIYLEWKPRQKGFSERWVQVI